MGVWSDFVFSNPDDPDSLKLKARDAVWLYYVTNAVFLTRHAEALEPRLRASASKICAPNHRKSADLRIMIQRPVDPEVGA